MGVGDDGSGMMFDVEGVRRLQGEETLRPGSETIRRGVDPRLESLLRPCA